MNMRHRISSWISLHMRDIFSVFFLIFLGAIFFYQSVLFGKIPAPTDALVGLYHPYRDSLASEYPNGMPYKNFLITDPVRQQIPWRNSVIQSFKRASVPRWDATSFSGTPFLANIQAGIFYPFNMVFLLFTFPTAWSLLIFSQIVLAGVSMYVLLRVLRLDPLSGIFGSVIFSYSGTSIAWLTWGTLLSTWAWAPLVLASIHELSSGESKHPRLWSTVAIIAVLSSFFAGHLQIFAYMIVLVLSYAIWRFFEKKTVTLRRYMLIGTVAFFAIAAQLLAIMSWLPLTSRMSGSNWKVDGFFIPMKHMVQFITPDFFGNPATLNYWGTWNYGELVGYIGVAGILFAMIGIRKQSKFWIFILMFALLFSIRSPVSTLPYVLQIPFLSSLQPTRLLFVIDLCLSLLAAFGFNTFFSLTKTKFSRLPVFLLSGSIIFLWFLKLFHGYFGIKPDNVEIIQRNLYLPTLLSFFTLAIWFLRVQTNKRILTACIALIAILILTGDLFRFGWKFIPFTDRSLFFPDTGITAFLSGAKKPNRIMTTDDRIFPPNVNTFYGIESINGYDPVHSLRYEQFVAAMERGNPNIAPPFGFERIIVPKNFRSPLFNLMSVNYILSFDVIEDPGFRELMTEGATRVYENRNVLPRAHLVSRVMYKESDQAVIEALYSPDFNYRTDAVVQYPVDTLNFDLEVSESVSIVHYEQGRVVLSVSVRQPRLIVLNNAHNPGWLASVDGKSTTIIRTNYLFMGVVVPEGDHKIEFLYR